MSALTKSRQTIRAAELLELGLRTSIVSRETGLTAEAVRQIHKEVNQCSPKSGQLPDTDSLLKTKRSQIEATLLVSIYSRFMPDDSNKVNLDNLVKTFTYYLELSSETRGFSTHSKSFSINEAWILVRAFLSKQLLLIWCECGGASLQNQHSEISRCPFCNLAS